MYNNVYIDIYIWLYIYTSRVLHLNSKLSTWGTPCSKIQILNNLFLEARKSNRAQMSDLRCFSPSVGKSRPGAAHRWSLHSRGCYAKPCHWPDMAMKAKICLDDLGCFWRSVGKKKDSWVGGAMLGYAGLRLQNHSAGRLEHGRTKLA